MVSDPLNIEVAYALPDCQTVLAVKVRPDTTVEEAIAASGMLARHPEIDLAVNKVGVYSRPVKLGDPLHEGDRIEIYRPLIADPREMRKKRADKAKEEGRANPVTGARIDKEP